MTYQNCVQEKCIKLSNFSNKMRKTGPSYRRRRFSSNLKDTKLNLLKSSQFLQLPPTSHQLKTIKTRNWMMKLPTNLLSTNRFCLLIQTLSLMLKLQVKRTNQCQRIRMNRFLKVGAKGKPLSRLKIKGKRLPIP